MSATAIREAASKARSVPPRVPPKHHPEGVAGVDDVVKNQAPLFAVVDLADLETTTHAPQDWFWSGYVPAGHLTYWSSHGGAGKTTLGLLLACCAAIGRDCLGKPTKEAVVCFFSAEDPRDLLLRRLQRLCRELALDYEILRERLIIIDATDFDPVLFTERRVEGMQIGTTTPTYDALARFVDTKQVDLLIVDNASDTFGADEIDRAMVRTFCRSLVSLVKARNGAVVLMAHVDKATSRAGKGLVNSESYSGSTAWHNSARSRLFLLETAPGALELQHQKCNLGPKQPPLAIEWPHDGIPRVQSVAAGPMQGYLDDNDTRALLRLLHEFHGRGEHVATATQSRRHAVALMSGEKTFPKRKPAEVFDLLRGAERRGWIEREAYKDSNRKPHERWVLTVSGEQFAEIPAGSRSARSSAQIVLEDGAPQSESRRRFAPSAPSAPSGVRTAPEPSAGSGAPSAPTAQRGVWGVEQRTSGAPDQEPKS